MLLIGRFGFRPVGRAKRRDFAASRPHARPLLPPLVRRMGGEGGSILLDP